MSVSDRHQARWSKMKVIDILFPLHQREYLGCIFCVSSGVEANRRTIDQKARQKMTGRKRKINERQATRREWDTQIQGIPRMIEQAITSVYPWKLGMRTMYKWADVADRRGEIDRTPTKMHHRNQSRPRWSDCNEQCRDFNHLCV